MASEKLDIKKTFFVNEDVQKKLKFLTDLTGNKEAAIFRVAIVKYYQEMKKNT